MKRFLTSQLLLLLSMAANCLADFEAAADAYRNKDYPNALAMFSDLAETGDARAQTVLALMYKYGEGTPQNLQTAFHWYKQAAEQGYAPAQFNLGEMYADGSGTQADRNQAVKWLILAAEAGFERANDKLAELNQTRIVSSQHQSENIPWSKNWNFRLPNTTRFPEPVDTPAEWNYRAQLAALSQRDSAETFWKTLKKNHPGLFNNLSPFIEISRFNGRELYRIQAGAFENFNAAESWCKRVQEAKIKSGCLPLKIN